MFIKKIISNLEKPLLYHVELIKIFKNVKIVSDDDCVSPT